MAKHSYPKALLIFTLASSFYLFEYILQVAPSVMMNDIMTSFGVGAVGFGTISSFYFYAYAPMQLPAGVLFDRYGPRALISLALLVCVAGGFLFGMTHTSLLAGLARFLVGTGSAFSFIGILILVARWFPPSQFALYVGVAQLLASVGAISGEAPLAAMSALIGWRACMIYLSCIGIVLALLVWLFVEDSPTPIERNLDQKGALGKEFKKLGSIGRDSQASWIGIYSFCSWTPMTVFAGLWAVPYLETVYHLPTVKAAHITALLWLGVGIGSPLLGWISDKVCNRRWPLLVSMVIGLVVSIMMITKTDYSITMLFVLCMVIGLASSGQALSFALVKEHNKPDNVGTASGFNNFMVVIGGAFLQPIFGVILNQFWDGKHHGITPIYSVDAYNYAMWVLPECYVVGIVMVLWFIDETYGKGSNSEGQVVAH